MAVKKAPVQQPKFDHRIYRLTYPLHGGHSPTDGVLKRGYMIWEKPLVGFTSRATMQFLYNPSTVSASYPISDSTVGAILQFPNPGDHADLRVPLQQTASWSLLFDRTYELWGSYDKFGKARFPIGKDSNNPQVVGCLADVIQMRQFTGMTVGYSQPGTPSHSVNESSFVGHQGIIQIVPAYVYFGGKENLAFYGYVSEWDLQITHWNQYMVPMRCVMNLTFTLLPPPQNTSKPGSSVNNDWGGGSAGHPFVPGQQSSFIPVPPVAGISGR